MSANDNKALLRVIPEKVYNEGDLDAANDVVHHDYIEHYPVPEGFPSGLEGLKTFVTLVRTGFPDIHMTVEDEIAEADRVVIRLAVEGTHTGEFMGIPATNRHATWTEIHVCRMADGKLVEHWENSDELGLFRQLGLVSV